MHRITFDATDGTKRQMYNLGVGGETSRGLAARIRPELAARHRAEWPAVIIIGIGKNDSRLTNGAPTVPLDEYGNNLEIIIAAAREITEKVFVVGMGPCATDVIDFKSFQYSRERLALYEAKLTEVAKRLGVMKVSVYDQILAQGSGAFYRDGLHLSDAGYELIYQAAKPVLLDFLAQP